MPGSAYHKIALQCTEWLSVVEECKINSSTKSISDALKHVVLDEDEEVVSFDVSSLYTNVPVNEAIQVCADLLYSGKYEHPPIDKETFTELLQLGTCNVLMQTRDGFYRQTDGLAMGSPPAPLLTNGWLNKYDPLIQDSAKLYSRYMDDIIRSIKVREIETKLKEINSLHLQLRFTMEREKEGSIPFLDMLILRENGRLSSTWYSKPTDTGLLMNFHALAPKHYKRSVVSGIVHRIYRSCSTWAHFHASLSRAKKILESNQYPPQFYEPIVHNTLEKIIGRTGVEGVTTVQSKPTEAEEQEVPKKMIFLQYRGIVTEEYCRSLRKCHAPCHPVLTLRKLKTVLPSLKPRVDKKIRSSLVYKLNCPRCESCYIGQTTQYLIDRFRQHLHTSQPVGKHLRSCSALKDIHVEDVEILAACTRSVPFLETLEVLW